MLFIMYDKSLMYNRKNSGPSIELCGTPCLTLFQSKLFLEYSFFIIILCTYHLNRILSDHLPYN